MLIVHIGSSNPQKIRAVQDEFRVAGISVDRHETCNPNTGVPEQPSSLDEVCAGAMNRAREALAGNSRPIDMFSHAEIDGLHLAVGLESGLVGTQRNDPHIRFTQTCCAVLRRDGERESWIYGFSSGFTIPERILQRVKMGHDLSRATALAGYTTHPKIGEGVGLIGLLSEGRVTRLDQLKEAVRNALFHIDTLL